MYPAADGINEEAGRVPLLPVSYLPPPDVV
jgi:hypothetical protein